MAWRLIFSWLMLMPSLLLIASCGPGGGGEETPAAHEAPVVESFGALPSSIVLGEHATLEWSVSDADSVSLDNGLGPQAGASVEVSPTETTVYGLTAENEFGAVSAEATVEVACRIEFSSGEGGSIAGESSQYVPVGGNAALVTATASEGYEFVDWTGEGFETVADNPLTLENVRANLSVTANFAPLPRFPALADWLSARPTIASSIKWQFRAADLSNVYTPPAEGDKTGWPDWTAEQRDELSEAYLSACDFIDTDGAQVIMPYAGLSDAPQNLHPNAQQDGVNTMERVSGGYAWKLYLSHVAFSLALEVTGNLGWSIEDHSAEELRYLLDSTSMAWRLPDGTYTMGTYMGFYTSALRTSNLPKTAFAPPEWTYPFLSEGGIVRETRLATIGAVLDWMRANMVHFYGADNFGTMEAVWQYRGYPPLSRIVEGTVDANNPGLGAQRWTAGCHGSVGFLAAALRAVNIPVQPVWVCGHELAWFMTEGRYLDHGDDPYNNRVKASGEPSLSLLIDEATYSAWFTADPTLNVMSTSDPACANVGRRAAEF